MTKNKLEKLYNEIENIEVSKTEIDFILLESEVMNEVYNELILNEPYSREKVEWLLKVNDYFNWIDKVTFVAEYNKKFLKKRLEKARAEIDRMTGESK